MGYRFESHEPVRAGVARIAAEQLEKATGELDDESLSPDRRVHQMRKRCKRARALLRLVRESLGSSAYREENARWRDLAQLASGARDAKVALDTFDQIAEGRPFDAALVAEIRSALDERLHVALPVSDATRALEHVRPALEEARAALPAWSPKVGGFDALAGGLQRTYERGLETLEEAFAEPTGPRFHEWRKHAKYGLYHADLLRRVWKPEMAVRRDGLKRLTDDLGDEHDLGVLRGHLEALGTSPVLAGLLEGLEEDRSRLRADARLAGLRLFAERPKAFRRRIEALWHAWRGPAASRTS